MYDKRFRNRRSIRRPRRTARRAASSRLATRGSRLTHRRGVLLLVVLSMLVLFLMIGTAFVIVAKQSEQAGKAGYKAAVSTSERYSQSELLEEALRQVIRDTNNPYSAIRGHSLLQDMYGNDGLKGVIALEGATVSQPVRPPRWATPTSGPQAGQDVTGGQLLEFDVVTSVLQPTSPLYLLRDMYGNVQDQAGNPLQFSHLDNAYNGQVLTFLTGPAAGRSTRIVGFLPPTTFRVMNFQLEDGSLVTDPAQQLVAANGQPTRILINGRPFNGTGTGFNPWAEENAPKLNAVEVVPGVNLGNNPPPLALMPNGAFRLDPSVVALPTAGTPPNGASYFPFAPSNQAMGWYDWNGRGGADESYDAVDFQNMALALVPGVAELTDTVLPNASDPIPSTLSTMVIPSWHRPELINYWRTQLNARNPLSTRPMLLRKIMLRPSWFDHPNFTGSNPEWAPWNEAFAQSLEEDAASGIRDNSELLLKRAICGPWDVDNDNDGVRDSVWVDIGLPVMNGPNGKLVKPLAAMLIVDLDGRVNVNAHGTRDLANAGSSNTPSVATYVPLADGTRSNLTPRGMGFGPADIDLGQVVGDRDFQRLLVGDTIAVGGQNIVLPGRYGFDPAGSPSPGYPNAFDLISQINVAGWPNWADARNRDGSSNRLVSGFATPPDLKARYGLGVNYFGQPVFEATLTGELRSQPERNLVVDSPYELNLAKSTAPGVHGVNTGLTGADAPFSVAELERVLRMYDSDSGLLPARLALLSNVLNQSGREDEADSRLKLTTDSYDLPAPNVSLPHEMHELLSENANFRRLPQSVAELYEMRIRAALNYARFPEPLDPPNDPSRPNATRVREVMRRILAPELAAGRRFDVNRPFGNGIDDNGNGVVDEPGETMTGVYDGGPETPLMGPLDASNLPNPAPAAAQAFATATFPAMATEVLPSPGNPNGQVVAVDHRLLYARQLYVLALTLTADPGFDPLMKGNRPQRADGRTGNDARDNDLLLARNLAQWAINVVDYRDPDNIMTAFEYDPDPFDGWDVDDDANTPDDRASLGGNIQVGGETDPLVWGLERPELVITETLAWHDRRTDDSAQADAFPPEDGPDTNVDHPTNPDADYDSILRPRGALFIELYNPWPGEPGVNADTHRAEVRGGKRLDLGVDLARTHTGDPATGDPVWRMAIYKRNGVPDTDAALWDPDDPNPQFRPRGPMDRSVYFIGRDPGFNDDGVAFFNDFNPATGAGNPVRPVRPGRLLVVSSGEETTTEGVYEVPIGDRKGSRNPRQDPKMKRRIQLDIRNIPGSPTVSYKDADAQLDDPSILDSFVRTPQKPRLEAPREGIVYPANSPDSTLLMQPAFENDPSGYIADVAIIDRVDLNAGQDQRNPQLVRRRLTVSEPAQGYPDKFRAAEWDEDDQQYKPLAIDVPLDGPIGGEAALEAQFGPIEDGNWPSYLAEFVRDPITKRGSWVSYVDPVLTQIRDPQSQQEPDLGASYSYIFLQRLANPLLPWNPPPAPGPDPRANGHDRTLRVNPYITVDSKSVNLTVMNSRGNDSGEEEDGSPANNARDRFASHERGYTEKLDNAGGDFAPSLFRFEMPSGERDRPPRRGVKLRVTPRNQYNRTQYRPDLAASNDYWFNGLPFSTIGFLNRPFQDTKLTDESRNAKPLKPFEWLPWANRPFISGNELMLVPRLRASRLFREFSTAENAPQGWSPYDPPTQSAADEPTVFGQLMGFFYEELGAQGGNPQNAAPGVPLHMYRLLEYVQTPSLYTGTRQWLNPSLFTNPTTGGSPTINDGSHPIVPLATPLNNVSEFRDPGRININTVFSRATWDALHHGNARRDGANDPDEHIGPDFDDEFVVSRRGYNAANPGDQDAMLLLEPNMPLNASPTFFANPFRSPDAGDLVPLPELVRKGSEVGLTRSVPDTTGAWVGSTDKLLFGSISERPRDDASRNPYFTYQPMIRLDNLVTTRSHVFAVWITIGFFEVETAPSLETFEKRNGVTGPALTQLYNRVYPDGYMLGREDGSDTGAIRRLKGFYIIDRSLPAGFEPGVDHNLENVVRLRRQIE